MKNDTKKTMQGADRCPPEVTDTTMKTDRNKSSTTVTLRAVKAIIAFLRGKGWVTSEKIISSKLINKRQLRRLGANSRGQILGSNRGYCLFEEATDNEIAETFERLRSQAKATNHHADIVEERYWEERVAPSLGSAAPLVEALNQLCREIT